MLYIDGLWFTIRYFFREPYDKKILRIENRFADTEFSRGHS